jgi:hypothetical protein
MTSRRCFQTLEFRRDPRFADFALRRLDFFFRSLIVVVPKDNFIITVVFIEQSPFVMDGARGNFHLHSVLFCVLFHLLEMFIVTVIREPRDDVTVRPVNLQCVRVLVVNMILSASGTMSDGRPGNEKKKAYINGHLVHMDTLLDAELRDKNIEGCIQNPDNLRLTNDRSIAGSQVRDEDT